MDKFDDYLKEKSNDENREFKLPKSFDDKLEETLASLDKLDKKNKLDKNKKLWATAACFAFICLAGLSFKQAPQLYGNNDRLMAKSSNDEISETETTTYDSSGVELANEERKMSKGQNNVLDESGSINEKIINIAYEWLDDYSKSTIIQWNDASVERFKSNKEYLIASNNSTVDISGKDTYRVIFDTTDNGILGPIGVYIDAESLEVLGCDFRE